MKAMFPVDVLKIRNPYQGTTHALMSCPRCLRGMGVTLSMMMGIDSIRCKGKLGGTGTICNGHYFFDLDTSQLRFIGT